MSDPTEDFDKERFSLEDLGGDESRELNDEEGEFCARGSAEALSPFLDDQRSSVQQAGTVPTDFTEEECSFPVESLPSGLSISAPDGADPPAQPSLQALVDGLLLPGRATVKSNDICAAIMLHPDLTTGSSSLSMYSKMSGGLRNYEAGTSHAWLYTPKRRLNNVHRSAPDFASDSFSLVFVYPEELGTSSDSGDNATQKSKTNLHFGGRSYEMCNGSVLLQHGTHKALRCVANEMICSFQEYYFFVYFFVVMAFIFSFSNHTFASSRLRARKFQLAITNSQAELTSSTDSFLNTSTLVVPATQKPSEIALPSSSLSLPAPVVVPSLSSSSLAVSAAGPSGDAFFEADVVRLQQDLQGYDLRRKLGLLREAWKREIASASSSELKSTGAGVEDGSPADGNGDKDGYDPHHQKRSKLRVGINGNYDVYDSNVLDFRVGEDLEALVDRCLKISAEFEGTSCTADALLQFKFDCLMIGEKLQQVALMESGNSNEKLHRREESLKVVHDESRTMGNSDNLDEFMAGFGPWIDELVKAKELADAR